MILFDYTELQKRIDEKFETRKAFAAAVGVSESTLRAWLQNKRYMATNAMHIMAEVLEIPGTEVEKYFFRRIN